jgi:hypothetical protein
VILADGWAASPLWVVTAIPVALVVGAASSWVVWRSARPRLRLQYALESVARLVDRDRLSGALEVRRDGQLLRDPYVATLVVRNTGRLDVAAGAFEDRPLRFDLGAPILETLEVVSQPEGLRAPSTRLEGTAILIGPDKVGGGRSLAVSVLVDGDRPRLAKPDNPLINVQLRGIRERVNDANRAIIVAALISGVFGLLTVVITAILQKK